MRIGNSEISKDSSVYFIAEIGSNFDGSLDRALMLIDLAKESGADAVKFQHYTAKTLVSDLGFRNIGTNIGHQKDWQGSVFDIYDKASLNREWTSALKKRSDKNNLGFITSPYSIQLLEYIVDNIDAIKIGSGDITWLEILSASAKKNKPILLATGASDLNEVKLAYNTINKLNNNICLMQCNTNYEGKVEHFKYQNIRVLSDYANRFPDALLGLSCHMPGHLSVLAAVSLGAKIVEKHFTDDNDRVGPDHKFAMNPSAWRLMVNETRQLESLLGKSLKQVEENEQETKVVQRRALRAKHNLKAGTKITPDCIESLRPCPLNAIKPSDSHLLIGKHLKKDLIKGDTITLIDIY